MMVFFSGLVYKANTHFIPVYASAYYRDDWINNAVIIVWVCWYGCQSVVCMCVIKKNCVCVHVCACNI